MSLEAVIAENTAAMKELITILQGAATVKVVSAEIEEPKPVKTQKVAEGSKTPEPPKAAETVLPPRAEYDPSGDAEVTTMPTAEQAEAAAKIEEAPALTYDDVAKLVKAAAMRSRAKVMALWADYGIKHLSEAKPAQWPAIKASLETLIAEAP